MIINLNRYRWYPYVAAHERLFEDYTHLFGLVKEGFHAAAAAVGALAAAPDRVGGLAH